MTTTSDNFIVILNKLHNKVLQSNARLAKVTAAEEAELYDALKSLNDEDQASMKSVLQLLMLRDALQTQKSISGQLSYATAVVNHALAQAAVAAKNGSVDVAKKLVKFSKRVAKFTVKAVKKLFAVLNSAINTMTNDFNKYVKPVLVAIKNGTIKVTTAVIDELNAKLAAAVMVCRYAFNYISAKVSQLGNAIAIATKSAAIATKDATVHAADVAVSSLGNAAVIIKAAVVKTTEEAAYNAKAKPLKFFTAASQRIASALSSLGAVLVKAGDAAESARTDLQAAHRLFQGEHNVTISSVAIAVAKDTPEALESDPGADHTKKARI